MIAISRVLARQFRAAARKCVNGRARAPDSDVVIRQIRGKLTLTAHYPEVILQLASPAQSEEEDLLVVPMQALDVIQEAKADPIELHHKEKLKGEARCVENGLPHTKPIQLIEPGKQHTPPTRPKELISISESFLRGLHECGRCAAEYNGRFAVDRIQVRGKQGQVIATDTHKALIAGGFRFPFAEDLLIPVIPLFGMKELQSQEVRVGRTVTHLVVSVGPWRAWLGIQTKGRFPEVESLVPRQAPTLVRFDLQDVTALLKVIARLPGANKENRPVTLELDGTVTIRSLDTKSGETKEIHLGQSQVEGTAARLAVDRKILARALSLGCHTIRITPEKPLVAVGEAMTFIAMPLDPDLMVKPKEETRSSAPISVPEPLPTVPLPERREDMKPNEPNGRSPNGRPEPPPTADTTDPLIVAEELRAALSEAAMKANKLVAILRTGRKEKKVLASVFAGLKQLKLTGGPLP
jgi:hypothetical protein